MGNTRWFEGGRKEPEYVTLGEFYGVKIVKKIEGNSSNTPKYSNSSKYYACADSITNEIKQITCYHPKTHAKLYDIDWTHTHKEFKEGDPHVHYYVNGVRQNKAVNPNKKQMRLYKIFVGKRINENGELE